MTQFRRWVLLILGVSSLAGSIAHAEAELGKKIQFIEVVRELSLAQDGSHYRVTFKGKAAIYRASRNAGLTACLEKSARTSSRVSVSVSGRPLQIFECQAIP